MRLRGCCHMLKAQEKKNSFCPPPDHHQTWTSFSPFPHFFLVVIDRNILQNEMVQLHGCTHVSRDALPLHSAGELGSVPGVHTHTVTHSASNSFHRRHILQSIRARVLVVLELSAASHVSARQTLHKQSWSLWDPFPSSRFPCHFPPVLRASEWKLPAFCLRLRAAALIYAGPRSSPAHTAVLSPPTSEDLFLLDRCDVVISDMASHPNRYNQSGDEYSTLLRGSYYLHFKWIHKCHVEKSAAKKHPLNVIIVIALTFRRGIPVRIICQVSANEFLSPPRH